MSTKIKLPTQNQNRLIENQNAILHCNQCDRLRSYCQTLDQRKSFANHTYWRKPVPSFGDPNAQLFILGLAPAAHGANRTGRLFTGDQSGIWLYRALYTAGLSNQISSDSLNDGLVLHKTYISNVVHCAPPENKPLPNEIINCHRYLEQELEALAEVRIFLALGQIAYSRFQHLAGFSIASKFPKFQHGLCLDGQFKKRKIWLFTSYHPSQQNTFTKKLTQPMFDKVFNNIRALIT